MPQSKTLENGPWHQLIARVAKMMDRRKDERHAVSGTAWFQWEDCAGEHREQTGSLRNVSALGLFVETNSPPPMGTEISIQFDFSGSDISPAVWIKAKGQVTRIEPSRIDGHNSGFGASTSLMMLQRRSETPTRVNDRISP